VFSCKQNEEKVIISESNSANNEKVAKELLYILIITIGKNGRFIFENAEFKEPASGMVAQKIKSKL
jgi:hypothetical protein